MEELDQLELVVLESTQVTAASVRRLEQALPNTIVFTDLPPGVLPPAPAPTGTGEVPKGPDEPAAAEPETAEGSSREPQGQRQADR